VTVAAALLMVATRLSTTSYKDLPEY